MAPPRPARPPRPPAHPGHQPRLALGRGVARLLEPALLPPRTHLTSTNSTIDTEGEPPRRGRSRCHPGTPGVPPTPPRKNKTGIHLKTGSGTVSNQTSRCLND